VLTTEPCRESLLHAMKNVTIQPHLGAFTKGTILRGERESVREWQAVVGLVSVARGATLMMGSLETGLPVNPVNEPVKVSRA